MDIALLITVVVVLLLVNAGGVVLTALQLPGNWVIVAATAGFAWWRWGSESWSYGWWTLAGLLGLAVLGEGLEFAAGALGSRSAGGSRRGAVISVGTALVGAVAGSLLIPVPIVGTLLGAAIGAGVGALLGDKWAGREWGQAWAGARGAAVGKLSGAAAKLAVAVAMWLLAAVMLFV